MTNTEFKAAVAAKVREKTGRQTVNVTGLSFYHMANDFDGAVEAAIDQTVAHEDIPRYTEGF